MNAADVDDSGTSHASPFIAYRNAIIVYWWLVEQATKSSSVHIPNRSDVAG